MSRYLNGIKKRSYNLVNRCKEAYYLLFAPHKGALYKYNQALPHPKEMISLFKKEWVSRFPAPFEDLTEGRYPLFEDPRLDWAMHQLDPLTNKTVLELGPLEGGHSYMLQKHGAASIVSVEGNPRGYLKCLLVKQIMNLDRVNFLFGDFNQYLQLESIHFDVCIASGVLYHMKNPIELLSLISQKCHEVFLWTHYYDPGICNTFALKSKFLQPYTQIIKGFKHTLYPFNYGSSRFWPAFIGGPARTSCWLSRQDILDALRYFGFNEIRIGAEELHSPHGPSFSLVAKKSKTLIN